MRTDATATVQPTLTGPRRGMKTAPLVQPPQPGAKNSPAEPPGPARAIPAGHVAPDGAPSAWLTARAATNRSTTANLFDRHRVSFECVEPGGITNAKTEQPMSRYYDGDYDSNFANEGDFWRHNADLEPINLSQS